MASEDTILLYIILGLVIGIIYSLRRIYFLEKKLASLDVKLTQLVTKKRR